MCGWGLGVSYVQKGRRVAEQLQSWRLQHRYEHCEVRGHNFKLKSVPQWIQWEIFGALSSTEEKFGLVM